MLRPTLSTLTLVVAIVATATTSWGDGPAKPTPGQEAARTAFQEEIRDSVKRVKDACGVDMSVATDFENFDEKSWRFRALVAGECSQVLDTVANLCSAGEPPRPERGKPSKPSRGDIAPAPQPVGARQGPEVKAVACLFGGHSAEKPGEDSDAWVQRNISFTNGVLTVQMHPRLSNVDTNTRDTLVPPSRARVSGKACTLRSECRSFACEAGTCQPCSPTVACAEGASCSSGGVCYKPSSDDGSGSSSRSSPSAREKLKKEKEPKKPLGAKCKWSTDCESKHCSSSPRTSHICVSR